MSANSLLLELDRLFEPRSPRVYVGAGVTRRQLIGGTAALLGYATLTGRRAFGGGQMAAEIPRYLSYGGPIARRLLNWSVTPFDSEAITTSELDDLKQNRLKHQYSIFTSDNLRAFNNARTVPESGTVHTAAFVVDPKKKAMGAMDAKAGGASSTALAVPIGSARLQASHPATNRARARANELLDELDSLFAPDHIDSLEAKVQGVKAAQKGDVITSTPVVEPNAEKDQSLIVTYAPYTNLRCSHHRESNPSGRAPVGAHLVYVGRKSNWVQVVVPALHTKEDRGYRWVDAANVGVARSDGKVVALHVNQTGGDIPGTWDNVCHTDRDYFCHG